MAMRGWIASTSNFQANVDNPSMMAQLKKFSTEGGGGPFTFEIADVVDTNNQEGTMDHSVWIEIFDKDHQKKLGELSTDVSDNEVPAGSNKVLLAACLDKLGFVDEFEGLDKYQADNPTPDPEPNVEDAYQENNLNPQDKIASFGSHAARLIEAIASTGIELDDSYTPGNSNYFGTSDDVRYQSRTEKTPKEDLVHEVAKLKQDLMVPTKLGDITLKEYLDKSGGNWTAIFGSSDLNIKRIGYKFRSLLLNFIQSSPRKQEYEKLLGGNLTDALVENKIASIEAEVSIKIAEVMQALDGFIESDNKPPFILEVGSSQNIPEEHQEPDKLHQN